MTEPPYELDDTSRAHSARIYDYILGGKDNYAVDRAAGDASLAGWPGLAIGMRENRAFMHRTTRILAAEYGIRQFLDIGTGIPTSPNLHEVVQTIAPDARIVYTDNDPIVLAHARALLQSTPEGRTAYIDADIRNTRAILQAPQFTETLDLTQPVALTIIGMLHCIEDDDEALRVVGELWDVLPADSYFVGNIATGDFNPGPLAKVAQSYREYGEVMELRSKERAARFFDGMELLEPGIVQMHKWRPDPKDIGTIRDEDIAMYAGVARKI